MATMRRIVFAIFEGFEILDLSGPAGVFSMASTLAGAERYRVVCASHGGGTVASGSGIAVQSRSFSELRLSPRDTLLVLGAEEPPLRAAVADAAITRFLRRASGRVGRVGSVCTGAFLLARAGLLDGRSATTHWAGCEALGRLYPKVKLEPDALYVTDGRVWTSAGVAAGIDMALAMLERDHGRVLMGDVARRLVVYAHRPGGQSQFSTTLAGQIAAAGAFSDIVSYIERTLDRALDVGSLARRAGMSERTFYRKFQAAVGMTPARFIDEARLDRAKRLLEKGSSVDETTAAVGFHSPGGFRAAFRARFGISPSAYRSHAAPRTSRHAEMPIAAPRYLTEALTGLRPTRPPRS